MATPAFVFLKNSRRAALLPTHSTWPVIGNDTPLVAAAIDRSVHNQLSIWDAMVIEAALRSEARTL